MSIVIIGDRYYVPFMDGFKEISKGEAQFLYEQGCFTTSEVETYEHD
jgi:hypothetical protein